MEAGKYRARAVERTDPETGETAKVFFGFSSQKETPQCIVHFEIVEDGDDLGRVVPWFGYFTANTRERTIQSLRHCGFRGRDLSAINDEPLDREVQLVIEMEEQEDEAGNRYDRPKVQWVNALGGGFVSMKKKMDQGALRRFAAEMQRYMDAPPDRASVPRGSSSGRSSQGRRSTAPVRRDDVPPPSDDDIPF
jgi:hypothetical protein